MTKSELFRRSTDLLKLLLSLAGFGLLLGLGVGSDKSMPKNAVVYLDHGGKHYIAPPCIDARETTSGLVVGTATEAYHLRYAPEPKCVQEGAFKQDDRSFAGHLLQNIGILAPIRSRWNPDGSWNW